MCRRYWRLRECECEIVAIGEARGRRGNVAIMGGTSQTPYCSPPAVAIMGDIDPYKSRNYCVIKGAIDCGWTIRKLSYNYAILFSRVGV